VLADVDWTQVLTQLGGSAIVAIASIGAVVLTMRGGRKSQAEQLAAQMQMAEAGRTNANHMTSIEWQRTEFIEFLRLLAVLSVITEQFIDNLVYQQDEDVVEPLPSNRIASFHAELDEEFKPFTAACARVTLYAPRLRPLLNKVLWDWRFIREGGAWAKRDTDLQLLGYVVEDVKRVHDKVVREFNSDMVLLFGGDPDAAATTHETASSSGD
jgi:hypothetical protein